MELTTKAERRAEKAENLSFCSGMKLLHIRKCVEEILAQIGKSDIFREYTLHNISHVDEMLKITDWLIPDETKEIMTDAEWLMLVLSVYFHDLGMVVTQQEFDNRYNSGFVAYKDRILKSGDMQEYLDTIPNKVDLYLYQEFVRENHAKRIRAWLEGKVDMALGDGKTVCDEIEKLFSCIDKKFKQDLAMICESHHLDDVDDFTKYKVNAMYGSDDNEKVNLNYIAIILRIADLLHITSDRTPSISRRLINVRHPVSVIEWEKQRAVKAVKPMNKRDTEGNVDVRLEKDTIEITAFFDGPETAEAYFGLSAYLQYTKKELKRCSEIVKKAQKTEGTSMYIFPWSSIDEEQIEVVGFARKKLQFVIEQENILQLLVGHTLYNDSSVVVRELVQNGIDAAKLQNRIEKNNNRPITTGKIDVEWIPGKKELVVWDNGTGMTEVEIEKYLLTVGASKYRSDSFRKEYPDFYSISHFGIGILTCFMIADDIDIITCSENESMANMINLRKVNGSYLLSNIEKGKLDERIRNHGTMVRLHVRGDVKISSVRADLKKWIVIPDVAVFYKEGEEPIEKIGYDSLKEILTEYLNDVGLTVDGKKYDVVERTEGNVSVAYAVKYQKYLSDWSLIGIDRIQRRRKGYLPIGTCIEGIRVEFSTPGYKNPTIFAIANIKNSRYQTNVARSAIELDANKEIISGIYGVYAAYIQDQMNQLESIGFSSSWSISESTYLMNPLLGNEVNNLRIEPMDESLLIEKLSCLKCFIVENPGKREVVSALEVAGKEELNVIESKLAEAAEHLLKEVHTDATLQKIMEMVCYSDKAQTTCNTITNFDEYNILHRHALESMEAYAISVDRSKRSIHLTYKTKKGLWDVYDIRKNSDMPVNLYIPKEDVTISGLEDEVGIKTVGGIYLRYDNEFCDYIKKLIEAFTKEKTDENDRLLSFLLKSIFGTSMLEIELKSTVNVGSVVRQLIDDRYLRMDNRVDDEAVERIWDKVDSDEFAKKILMKNNYLFSIHNWSRQDHYHTMN